MNHTKEDCYFKKKTLNSRYKMAFFCENNRTKDFIVDSSATTHPVNHLSFLQNLEKVDTNISVANKSESIKVEGKGKIELDEFTLNILYRVVLK